MADKLTDAQLVETLQFREQHGATKAAELLGISQSALRDRVRDAKANGLTATTILKRNEADRLKTQLKLANATIERLKRDDETAEAIRAAIYGLSERSPEPPQWLLRDGAPGTRGTPMTIWSDWHWGEVINADEIGGVNEFNAEIGKSRAKKLVETTIDLAFNHMGRAATEYPGIVICLGGDMIGGDIHEELAKTNDRTPQQSINELTDVLGAAIETMAGKFGKVFLPCVVGNHGRSTKRMQMKQRVFTSYEWNIYCNLERHFRPSKHVQFMVPSESDAFFSVYGHRYLLTHGDSLGVKGGDGIIGAIGPIMRGSMKIHRSEGEIGRDFDTLLCCHWHQYLTLPGLIVNNSFKGYDEYARLALRAPYSRPSQALWFSHPEHGITAHWQVYLEKLRSFQDKKQWVSFQQEV